MQIGVASGFKGPLAIHIANDKIYISEWSQHQIAICDLSFKFLKSFPDQKLKTPHGISSDSEDRIYVTEYDGRAIHQFSSDGKLIKTLITAEALTAPWLLSGPVKTVVDKEGNLLLIDFNSDSLQKFSKDGKFLGWIGAHSPDRVTSGWSQDISKRPSRGFIPGAFDHPNALCLDKNENIYVADTENNRIQKFSKDGKFLGWIGSKRDQGHGAFTSRFEMTGEAQSSLFPRGFFSPICLDVEADSLIVGEFGHPRIQKFSLEGEFQGWLGGISWDQSAENWKMDGLSAPGNHKGMFFHLYDLRIRGSKIFVADTYNSRVQVFDFS
ncbi:MAG: hypothetical protein J0L93_03300 [Deltaproteobacteria bacterium]|nr:hypothetical protein [Deltaproteobacteria bacterium]